MRTETSKRTDCCEKIMEEFLLLDKNEVIPFKLTLHFLKCQKCRTEVHYLSLSEKLAAQPLKTRLTPSAEIDKKKNPISMTKWVLCGFIMTLFLIIFGIASKSAASELQVAFYIFFALSICVYCAIFIASNLDYFVKKISSSKVL